ALEEGEARQFGFSVACFACSRECLDAFEQCFEGPAGFGQTEGEGQVAARTLDGRKFLGLLAGIAQDPNGISALAASELRDGPNALRDASPVR
ncbi:MAG: hypothetical protein U1E22_03170, partial [Coriobacteriia bacterium]|nr:hypothetical protein [Coriobacteriia bacterium]